VKPVRRTPLDEGVRKAASHAVRDTPSADIEQLRGAFDEVFDQALAFHGDQALVFHGFADLAMGRAWLTSTVTSVPACPMR
jgi:hypothetical protein